MTIFPHCTIEDVEAAAEHLVSVGVAVKDTRTDPPRYLAVQHERMTSQAGAYWEVFEALRAGRSIQITRRQ
jgi:hypothetical protein